MIHAYIGKGKGKTTAATGIALRAKGAGKKVCFIQFLKGGCRSSEARPMLKAGIKIIRFKQTHPMFCKKVSIKGLKKQLIKDLEKTQDIIKEKKYNVIILDEILYALTNKYIKEEDILKLIMPKPENIELIMTGGGATAKILQLCDYVSCIKNIKHPYQKGIKARRGIEF